MLQNENVVLVNNGNDCKAFRNGFLLFLCFLLFCSSFYSNVMALDGSAQEKNANIHLIPFNDWQFRQVGQSTWNKAVVPGTVHTDLLENKLIEDPYYRTNEKDLQWIDKVDWEYKTSFDLSADILSKQHIELCFKGLDTYADVYINGNKMLAANNMFREWKIDCKAILKEKDNELRIYFHSPVLTGLKEMENYGIQLPATNDQSETGGMGSNKVSEFVRKAPYHFGWDWGPRLVTSGIWRPVFIDVWNDSRICDVQIFQQLDKSVAHLTARYEIESSANVKRKILLAVNDKFSLSKEIQLQSGLNTIDVKFEIKNPQLWWPNGTGEAYLYNISSTLVDEKSTLDARSVKIGIRSCELVRDKDKVGSGSSFYFKINGLPVFAKGANYIPNDVFLTRVKQEDYEFIVKSAADANMNIIRVWGGGIYENNEFYELCDRYGIMVWQDFMFACSMYPGNSAFLDNIKQEAVENVKRLRNHSCIVLWCGNNEMDGAWQQYNPHGGWGWKESYAPEKRKMIWNAYDTVFNKILPSIVNSIDSGRFYWPSSPMADMKNHAEIAAHSGDTHYWDVWWGQKPFSEYNNNVGRFMSEYGFQSFPEFSSVQKYAKPEDYDIFSEVMKAHQRSSIGNGTILNYMKRDYIVPTDFEKFLYVGQLLQAEGIKTAIEVHRRNIPYCMGSLFWQINDCWPVASWSSIDYYKRWKALQYFAKKAFAETAVLSFLENDSVKIYVATDKLVPVKATLGLKLVDFSGKVLWEKRLPAFLVRNKTELLYTSALSGLLKNVDKTKVVLTAELVENNKSIAGNLLYLVPPKDLKLPKPTIQKNITKTEKGFSIVLKSDEIAKNVFLNLGQCNGFFSDNYFDLLPGKEVKVDLNSTESLETIEKQLKIVSLVDSY